MAALTPLSLAHIPSDTDRGLLKPIPVPSLEEEGYQALVRW